MKKIEQAIISLSDKTGVIDFARGLVDMGVKILSTGGTAKALREAGIAVVDIAEYTGSPEILDGRVKTLHPKVHAGLLYMRGNEKHEQTMREQGFGPIDLVAVNLYPFESVTACKETSFEEAIENIDIGGPTMIRSAAKNMHSVTVVTDPADYQRVLSCMRNNEGATTRDLRLELAQKVFVRVAEYNAAIAAYLSRHTPADDKTTEPVRQRLCPRRYPA